MRWGEGGAGEGSHLMDVQLVDYIVRCREAE